MEPWSILGEDRTVMLTVICENGSPGNRPCCSNLIARHNTFSVERPNGNVCTSAGFSILYSR